MPGRERLWAHTMDFQVIRLATLQVHGEHTIFAYTKLMKLKILDIFTSVDFVHVFGQSYHHHHGMRWLAYTDENVFPANKHINTFEHSAYVKCYFLRVKPNTWTIIWKIFVSTKIIIIDSVRRICVKRAINLYKCSARWQRWQRVCYFCSHSLGKLFLLLSSNVLAVNMKHLKYLSSFFCTNTTST